MNSLDKVYSVLARDFSFWLPDYSDSTRPVTREGNFIPDTDKGYNHYCRWLTAYLTNNSLPIADYQIPIIKRLKKKKEISNPYILANAGISMASFFFETENLEKYPDNFLENPHPSRINVIDTLKLLKSKDLPHFRGLETEENLQALFVFEFISIRQNLIYSKITEPRWYDIGWRRILQEGLKTFTDKKDKVIFTKNFINEIAYLQSK